MTRREVDVEKDVEGESAERRLSFLTGDVPAGEEREPVLDVPAISMLPEAPPPAPPGPRRGGRLPAESPLEALGASVRELARAARAQQHEIEELRRLLNALD
jgi:hypothetical protein